jgi:hypothetical protein
VNRIKNDIILINSRQLIFSKIIRRSEAVLLETVLSYCSLFILTTRPGRYNFLDLETQTGVLHKNGIPRCVLSPILQRYFWLPHVFQDTFLPNICNSFLRVKEKLLQSKKTYVNTSIYNLEEHGNIRFRRQKFNTQVLNVVFLFHQGFHAHLQLM